MLNTVNLYEYLHWVLFFTSSNKSSQSYKEHIIPLWCEFSKWLTLVSLFWTHILQALRIQMNVKMGRRGGNYSTTTFMIALGNEFSTAVLIRRGRKIFIIHVAFIVLLCYGSFSCLTLVFGYVFNLSVIKWQRSIRWCTRQLREGFNLTLHQLKLVWENKKEWW